MLLTSLAVSSRAVCRIRLASSSAAASTALASRFTPLHPAVLRLIRMTREVADAQGIAVSVCGEMASDPLMAFTLVGLGIRQLSVSPISLPRVKALIRGMRISAAVEAAAAAMDAATADDAETILRAALHAEVDGELLHT